MSHLIFFLSWMPLKVRSTPTGKIIKKNNKKNKRPFLLPYAEAEVEKKIYMPGKKNSKFGERPSGKKKPKTVGLEANSVP